jgi:hypothetical protein
MIYDFSLSFLVFVYNFTIFLYFLRFIPKRRKEIESNCFIVEITGKTCELRELNSVFEEEEKTTKKDPLEWKLYDGIVWEFSNFTEKKK